MQFFTWAVANEKFPWLIRIEDVAFVTSRTPKPQRTELVKSFQDNKDPEGAEDRPSIILGSMTAIGVGANLLPARRTIQVDLYWLPQRDKQGTGRTRRANQPSPFTESFRFIPYAKGLMLNVWQKERDVLRATLFSKLETEAKKGLDKQKEDERAGQTVVVLSDDEEDETEDKDQPDQEEGIEKASSDAGDEQGKDEGGSNDTKESKNNLKKAGSDEEGGSDTSYAC